MTAKAATDSLIVVVTRFYCVLVLLILEVLFWFTTIEDTKQSV